MNNDFNYYLLTFRQRINSIIFYELSNRKPKSLYQPINYFFKTGGKRLRSILLLLTAHLTEKDIEKLPFNQAVAIELLHNFTLIHDDIMDNSIKRHNKETLHVKYDINTAILAGDSLLAMAYKFLSTGLKNNLLEVINEFTDALTIVCDGQALDKEFESKKRITLQQYYEMIKSKTGALIKSCCRIGALTVNMDSDLVNQLGNFGEELGVAFQIQDDLMDVVSNEKLFGKKRGSDLIEGKKTFLLIQAMKLTKGKDLQKIESLVKNKGIKQELVKDYFEIYHRNKVIEKTREAIQQHFSNAEQILNRISSNYGYDVSLLKEFLNLVITRKN